MYCIGYFMLRQKINAVHFVLYQMSIWFILSFFGSVYSIYRFTKPTEIISRLFCILFLLLVIAFYPFSKQAIFNFNKYFLFSIVSRF
jgi:putative colanic acid biosynthesis UDP-glucose lipid carrier transferase